MIIIGYFHCYYGQNSNVNCSISVLPNIKISNTISFLILGWLHQSITNIFSSHAHYTNRDSWRERGCLVKEVERVIRSSPSLPMQTLLLDKRVYLSNNKDRQ